MKKLLVIIFLCFLVLGLTLNVPILLAKNGDNYGKGNSLITGSAVEDDGSNIVRERIRFKDGEFEIRTRLRVEGDEDNLSTLTSDGRRHRIKINPEMAKARIRERWGNGLNISNISLEEVKHKNLPAVFYKIQTSHQGRFLGIFKMILKAETLVDAEEGEVLEIKVPWWAFLLTGLEIPDDLPGKGDKEDKNETDDDNETENNAPVITSTPITTIDENASYNYQVTATDIDTNNTLTYSLTQNPAGWISINSSMGLVEGMTPLVDNDTNYTISIKVSDGVDFDTQTYNLTVINSTA